jgi:hypothetical protein
MEESAVDAARHNNVQKHGLHLGEAASRLKSVVIALD